MPARSWRGATRRRPRPVAGDAGGGAAAGSSNPGSSSCAAGSLPMASPTASIARPTATMCAWYQVVASCAAYQKTVPKAKKTAVASRTARSIRSRPSIHQHSPTSTAARAVNSSWSSVARPQRHERQQDDRRQRGERQEAARHAVGRAGRAGRPGRTSCRPTPRRLRRGSGWRPGPRGRRPPATRSGRTHDRPAWPGTRRRRPASVRRRSRWTPDRPGATLCYAPIHLPRSCRSRIPGDWPRIRGARARHGSIDTGDRDAGSRRRDPGSPRARSRPPTHHRIPAAGIRIRGRSHLVPLLGGQPGP